MLVSWSRNIYMKHKVRRMKVQPVAMFKGTDRNHFQTKDMKNKPFTEKQTVGEIIEAEVVGPNEHSWKDKRQEQEKLTVGEIIEAEVVGPDEHSWKDKGQEQEKLNVDEMIEAEVVGAEDYHETLYNFQDVFFDLYDNTTEEHHIQKFSFEHDELTRMLHQIILDIGDDLLRETQKVFFRKDDNMY